LNAFIPTSSNSATDGQLFCPILWDVLSLRHFPTFQKCFVSVAQVLNTVEQHQKQSWMQTSFFTKTEKNVMDMLLVNNTIKNSTKLIPHSLNT
jgi:hypothetical protein